MCEIGTSGESTCVDCIRLDAGLYLVLGSLLFCGVVCVFHLLSIDQIIVQLSYRNLELYISKYRYGV